MKMNQATLTAPKEKLLHLNISTLTERLINDKIQANINFHNSINIKYILKKKLKQTSNYIRKLK